MDEKKEEEKISKLIPISSHQIDQINLPAKISESCSNFDSKDSFDSIVREIAKTIDHFKKMEIYYNTNGDLNKFFKISKTRLSALKELTSLIDLRKKLYGSQHIDLDSLEFRIMGQYFIETLKRTFEEFCVSNGIKVEGNFTKQFLNKFSNNMEGWQSEVYKRIENIKAE